jgi:hypothetical protein
MKIAINKCYGGFDLSDKAHEKLIELGVPLFESWDALEAKRKEGYKGLYIVRTDVRFGSGYSSNLRDYENRTNTLLIQTVEELEKEASGRFGKIRVVEIPDDVNWEIDDYDGIETIREHHRSW